MRAKERTRGKQNSKGKLGGGEREGGVGEKERNRSQSILNILTELLLRKKKGKQWRNLIG